MRSLKEIEKLKAEIKELQEEIDKQNQLVLTLASNYTKTKNLIETLKGKKKRKEEELQSVREGYWVKEKKKEEEENEIIKFKGTCEEKWEKKGWQFYTLDEYDQELRKRKIPGYWVEGKGEHEYTKFKGFSNDKWLFLRGIGWKFYTFNEYFEKTQGCHYCPIVEAYCSFQSCDNCSYYDDYHDCRRKK